MEGRSGAADTRGPSGVTIRNPAPQPYAFPARASVVSGIDDPWRLPPRVSSRATERSCAGLP